LTEYLPDSAGLVLKTDCFNEAAPEDFKHLDNCGLHPQRTCYLEINPLTVARARARYPERWFCTGDLRRMPFQSTIFAAVADLSTIDHIAEVEQVIQEYYRVLQPGGRLIMVSWCHDEPGEHVVNWDGPQYFHYQPRLEAALEAAKLRTIHAKAFYRRRELYLMEFVCLK